MVTPVFIDVLVTALFRKISPPSSPDCASILRVVPSYVNVDSPLAWPETPVAVRTLLSVLFNTVNPDVPLVPDDPEDPLDPEVPEDPEPASSITFITGPSDSPNWKLLPLTVVALSE